MMPAAARNNASNAQAQDDDADHQQEGHLQVEDEVHNAGNEDEQNMESVHIAATASSNFLCMIQFQKKKNSVYDDMIATSQKKVYMIVQYE